MCFDAWNKAVGRDIDDPVELNTAQDVRNDAAAGAEKHVIGCSSHNCSCSYHSN